jgi:hypothetical protein
MRGFSVLTLLALAACGGSSGNDKTAAAAQQADSARPTTTAAAGGSVAAPAAAAGSAVTPVVSADAPVLRGLYVNRFAAQSTKRMKALVAMADSTEVNSLVIDWKDEFGLNFASQDPMLQRNAGKHGVIRDPKALLDTLKAHGIAAIARIVVFKDPVAAEMNPDMIIQTPAGAPWKDHKGNAWVNPYDQRIWEYNLRVAEEAARAGFPEIQFDYIRFPEPFKSLPQQVYGDTKGVSKPQVLAEFLKVANARLDKLGARSTADVFGLVTTVNGPLEIAQHWEVLSPTVDVILPMTYPSHYPRGSFGVARPNAEPYTIMYKAIVRAHERDEKLGLKGEHVRPWIQAFTLGAPAYGPKEIEEQKRAIYDAGYDGWVLWHPGSKYEPFLPGLEKTLESRKKADWAAK